MVIHSIIVAAGSGSRFGGPVPKQFMSLKGIPVAMHAIMAIRSSIPDATDTIVLSESEIGRWKMLCDKHGFRSPDIVVGGATRFDSVKNALAYVPNGTDVILVHDGARPFPPRDMVERIKDAFDDSTVQGVIPAIPVTDSIRRLCDDGTSYAVDRSVYRAVQTPQAFKSDLLVKAYSDAPSSQGFTDDASVMEAAGFTRLILVDGSPKNIKITNPGDIATACAVLQQ